MLSKLAEMTAKTLLIKVLIYILNHTAVNWISYLVEGVHGEQNHPGNVQRFNYLIGYCGFT